VALLFYNSSEKNKNNPFKAETQDEIYAKRPINSFDKVEREQRIKELQQRKKQREIEWKQKELEERERKKLEERLKEVEEERLRQEKKEFLLRQKEWFSDWLREAAQEYPSLSLAMKEDAPLTLVGEVLYFEPDVANNAISNLFLYGFNAVYHFERTEKTIVQPIIEMPYLCSSSLNEFGYELRSGT
jgi:hypothetical protein